MKSTHGATDLNLGHLIPRADNHHGSFRGLGAELRVDAWGAARAVQGWLITIHAGIHSANNRDTINSTARDEVNRLRPVGSIAPANFYGFVQKVIANGREIELEAMGDLVNFICAALIYKEPLYQVPSILVLFRRVKRGVLIFVQVQGKDSDY